MLPVVILAGGLATRLRPLSLTMPKSLIEIDGKPFIYHQLEYLEKQGVTSVIMCIGHMGDKVKKAVGSGTRWNIKVTYSSDHPYPLGTGGAVRFALPKLEDDFFILYGDSYLPINFSEVERKYKESKKKGLMTLLRNNNRWDKSNVKFEHGNIVAYSKSTTSDEMKYIDYGLNILNCSVLESYPGDKPFDLSLVYSNLAESGTLMGYEVFHRFYEVGSFDGIKDTQNYLLNGRNKNDICKKTFK